MPADAGILALPNLTADTAATNAALVESWTLSL